MNEISKASAAIFTTEPGVEQIAMNEIQLTNTAFKFDRWIDSGVALIKLENGFKSLVAAFRQTPPIFIRHICPVHVSISLSDEKDVIDSIEKELTKLIFLLNKTKTFSVQTRLYSKEEKLYKRYDINQRLSDNLIENGFVLDVKSPEQIVSVVCTTNTAYVGISEARDNLSDWGGGSHRFSREEGLISRAEFKLLEAIDVFKLEIPVNGRALDLGAAPGGWTKVLRTFDLQVVSVDPAELHPSIISDSGVTHIKQTAQNYFKTKEQFDIIVNDMRMDAKESAQIMGLAMDCLKPDGIAVMTLKLPGKGMQKITYQAIEILKEWYQIIGARQLFHNRLEVTVVMKTKDA
jgi:23S rRNA (cytidine2498-2'-O)-methyltransferase